MFLRWTDGLVIRPADLNVVVDQMVMGVSRLSDDGDWWEGLLTLRLLTVP